MTWSAVGVTQGDNSTNLTLSNQGVGNLIIAEVINFSGSGVWATGLSGGGATWVQAGVKLQGSANAQSSVVFFGTVTATGAGTATISWSGTAPASFGVASREFHSTVGSWFFVTQGNLDSSGTANWSSLSATAGDLYWGYASDNTAATAGSTSGYTYDASADSVGNGMAFNVNCAGGATNPAWGDSGQAFGIMVLVREGSGAAPPDGPMGNRPLGWPAPLTAAFGPNQPFEAGGYSIDAAPALTVNAGVATAQAIATNVPFKPFIAGLGGTGYNSWFTDQAGNPRLAVVEQGWALPFNAGRFSSGNWQGDFTTYFSTRAAQGYTAWYGVAWGSTHVDSTALAGRSYDGVYALKMNGTPGIPVTGAETLTLNTPFWDRIDAMFATARQYGIACFLNMGLTYDFSDAGAIWQHASNTQANAFGAALAARFPPASYPHVFWFFGDDDGGGNDTFWSNMLTGMQGAGDNRPLIAIEYLTNENSHVEFDNGTAVGTFGAASATYNWVYSYDAPYFGLERSYAEGGTFAHIPPLYGDGIYYGDSGGGPSVETAMRTFVWWALASGSRGFPSTSGPSFSDPDALWMFATSAALGRVSSDPNGTWTTTNVGRIATYFGGLTDWHKLIPDTGNVFVTAGRGTRGTCDAPGSGFNVRTGNTYVAASITPNGTLAVIYCRAAMSITIDQTKMNTGYTATWVDPSNPTLTQSATTGSTYSSSGLGNNAAGQPDWVLVLQAPPAITATAGVAAATATALSPLTAHTGNPNAATSTAVASAPSVASTAAGGVAPGSATSLSALTAHTATSGVATGPATALGTSSAHTATSGVAASSAVSAPPVPAAGATPPAAASSATALTASDTGNPSAGAANASSAAVSPVIAVTVNAGVAAASALAVQPTVNTSGSTNAPAGAAASSALAAAPSTAITLAGGVAQSSAVAASPSVTSTAAPGAGGGAALAVQPSIALAVHAGVAQASATALNATAQATGSVQAGAGTASAIAAAPSTAITVHAGVAQSSAVANPATVSTVAATNANAGVAAATASAMTVHVSSAAQPAAPAALSAALAPVPAAGGLAGIAQSAGAGAPAVIGRFAQVASSAAQAMRPVISVAITAEVATASAVASGGHVPKQIVPGTVSVPVVKVATAIAGIAGRATATGRSSDA